LERGIVVGSSWRGSRCSGYCRREVAREHGPADVGEFPSPFTEGRPDCPHGVPLTETEAKITRKPTAVNVVALPHGKLLYWDGLEAEEDVKLSIVAELGDPAFWR
jgi:hypothetical protein